MATKMMTKGMTTVDHIVAWSMMAGLAVALVQCAQTMALPAHFV
ncbi:hypothetical protein [Methylobacterium pseudosasicola]|uniref:Uncharacterized protein n=1 Tax=Methylobacterium pseudosasicola TaxID=582667 RepID=A0A1I4Q438_9HYPH|nr:hypothetical protein [Methylobacterium pseudosasicola]SFM34822.1 hypothetical protein SAMN05192568_102813 [Methylobacterium pseudosasicola]